MTPNEPRAVPAGMKPWSGGDRAPDDWDGGPVMVADDTIWHPEESDGDLWWGHSTGEGGCIEFGCIIAYTPRPTEQPAIVGGVEREALIGAAQAVVENAQRSYRSRGKDRYIEDESGECMMLVPHEDWYRLQHALTARPPAPAEVDGGVLEALDEAIKQYEEPMSALTGHELGERLASDVIEVVRHARARAALGETTTPSPVEPRSTPLPAMPRACNGGRATLATLSPPTSARFPLLHWRTMMGEGKRPPDWATVPHDDVLPWCEVRLNGDGTIDEIVTHKSVTVHLEQMADGKYWIGLTDKSGDTQHIMLTRHGKHIFPTVHQ